jgi:hypothetical protein
MNPSETGSASSQEKLTLLLELESEHKFELLTCHCPSKDNTIPHQDLTGDSAKLEGYRALTPSRPESIDAKYGAVEPDMEEGLTERDIAEWEGQNNDYEIVDEIKRTIGGLSISPLAWELGPSMFDNDDFENILGLVLETLKFLQ